MSISHYILYKLRMKPVSASGGKKGSEEVLDERESAREKRKWRSVGWANKRMYKMS